MAALLFSSVTTFEFVRLVLVDGGSRVHIVSGNRKIAIRRPRPVKPAVSHQKFRHPTLLDMGPDMTGASCTIFKSGLLGRSLKCHRTYHQCAHISHPKKCVPFSTRMEEKNIGSDRALRCFSNPRSNPVQTAVR